MVEYRHPYGEALKLDVQNILAGKALGVSVPADTIIFRPGQPCERLVLLTSGSVKVHLIGESGREIFLYRVQPDQICALSLGCLINQTSYNATGTAETDLNGLAISRDNFNEIFANSMRFRDSVLRSQTTRILEMIGLLEDLAFRPIEQRLARLLSMTTTGDGPITKTHQEMATDLGTAREVVSRTLKRFEEEGLIQLARGSVTIADRDRLSALLR